MSHWCHTMVDGDEFLISCKQPAFLSSFRCLQVIQNSATSTILWRHCDIRILYVQFSILQFIAENCTTNTTSCKIIKRCKIVGTILWAAVYKSFYYNLKIVWFVQQSCRNLSTKRGKVVQRKLKCQTLFGPATELKKKKFRNSKQEILSFSELHRRLEVVQN